MRDARMTAELAARASVRIPHLTEAMENLVVEYEVSTLAEFHAWFYSAEHDPPKSYWKHMIAPHEYSACVRERCSPKSQRFAAPAEWYAHGDAHNAGARLAPAPHRRAHSFEVGERLWLGKSVARYRSGDASGLLHRCLLRFVCSGRADLVDFHCQSTKEDKICLAAECPANLELFRRLALARRRYDDLAHRPFNRLFLPEEHR